MKKYFHLLLLKCCMVAVVTAGAQQVNISLRVNEEAEASVFQDETLLLQVAVSNKKAQSDLRWNMAGKERMAELNELLKQGKIKQEEYDREKASIEKSRRTPPVTELGSATVSWTSAINWKVMNTANRNYIELPVSLMQNPSAAGKAVLDANGYYIACFGIAPGELKKTGPGTYAIECIINNIPSNAVLLTIRDGMMSETMAASEPVLLQTGRYYWHAGNGAKTMEYADRVLAKNPASLDGLSLKGDGQLLQRSYLPALETYNKAIAEYYKQNGKGSEPPEYLISMIDFIKKEMGQ